MAAKKKWRNISAEEADILIALGVAAQYRYKKGRGHVWMDAVGPHMVIRRDMVEHWKVRKLGRYKYQGKYLFQELEVRVQVDE